MKKLFKRVFGIAASAMLFATSAMPTAFADRHAHHSEDKKITDDPNAKYKITLTLPDGYKINNEIEPSFGAYQIFTGTVENGGTSYTNPGDYVGDKDNTNKSMIPLTDIKWGNAFGIQGSKDVPKDEFYGTENEKSWDDIWRENIIGFVYALANPPTSGDYASAFTNFNGFNGDNGDTGLTYEKFSGNAKDTLADRFYYDSTPNTEGIETEDKNNNNVNFDKLATEVADVINKHNDRIWLQAFTDILGGYGASYAQGDFVDRCYSGNYTAKMDKEPGKYEIMVPEGYYMILDRTGIDEEKGFDESYSARMLFVANNITQEIKQDVPSLTKTIAQDNKNIYGSKTEAAGVGDEVKFRLTGKLPSNYDQYTLGYQFKFTDTLSNGLTLKELTPEPKTYVTVTVKNVYNADGTPVTDDDGKEYTIIKTESYKIDGTHITHAISAAYKEEYDKATNVLTVTFPCLKEIVIKGDGGTDYYIGADSEIYIYYTAVVNENAIVSPTDGNENTAKLTYSDNPQAYDDTDNTTPKQATVYTFGLDITKVDAADFLKNGGKESAQLKDVQFMLARPVAGTLTDGKTTATTEWEVATLTLITSTEIESMNPKPTVKSFLDNGYYSIVSWTKLEDTKKGATFDPTWVTDAKEVVDGTDGVIIKTFEKGILNISGLDVEVLYSLAEVTAPTTDPKGEKADYAKINPFTFKLSAQMNTEKTEYTGRLSGATSEQNIETGKSFSFDKPVDITGTFDDTNDGSAKMLVANFKYVDLPSTGGVGTYLFYILGAGGLAISFLLFKMSRKKAVN